MFVLFGFFPFLSMTMVFAFKYDFLELTEYKQFSINGVSHLEHRCCAGDGGLLYKAS